MSLRNVTISFIILSIASSNFVSGLRCYKCKYSDAPNTTGEFNPACKNPEPGTTPIDEFKPSVKDQVAVCFLQIGFSKQYDFVERFATQLRRDDTYGVVLGCVTVNEIFQERFIGYNCYCLSELCNGRNNLASYGKFQDTYEPSRGSSGGILTNGLLNTLLIVGALPKYFL